jgi:chemotaxis protein methyltransferase CheR
MELHRIILPYRKRNTVNFEQGHALAEAIVDTVREPLLVLDHNLRVVAASRSFYLAFRANRREVQGRLLYALGDGQWDIPQLRTALKTIIFTEEPLEAFEVVHDFPSIGRRTMVLNARRIYRAGGKIHQILLSIEDVTERARLEREHALAHERIALLLQELTHRVKNSLQSIAAMVMIEARIHKSSEGKAALERVSQRIDALGQLYAKLSRSNAVEAVDAATYLDDLCRELVASTQRDGTSIELKTDIESELLPTDQAIPMGLIVNELVTNALKYAFPSDTNGTVMVALKRASGELRLTVADNGKGIDTRRADSGLGGRLVDGFAAQLGGRIERESSGKGTTVRLIVPSQERRSAIVSLDCGLRSEGCDEARHCYDPLPQHRA